MIKITSKRDGFYRCGIPHPLTATEYPNDRFSKDELKVLEAEPMLVVERVKDKETKKDPNKDKTEKPK